MYPAALSVLGAGSYGTALAVAAALKGLPVTLWARSAERAAQMQQDRQNSFYLRDIPFPDSLSVTSDLQAAAAAAPIVLIVVPSHSFGALLTELKPLLRQDQRVCWATKGLDLNSGRLLSELAAEILGDHQPFCALSGPTFARELAAGLPTAIAVAGNNADFCAEICQLMHSRTFRLYQTADFIGLQLGGAVKNVIAIGAGMSDGLGYGANARTALISRGLVEMQRLGVAMGATERCFSGLSGLGDLILTCTDNQSRNRRFGMMLGRGLSADEALQRIGQVVEGLTMTSIIYRLIQRYSVDMPICSEIHAVLYAGKSARDAAVSLLSRDLTSE